MNSILKSNYNESNITLIISIDLHGDERVKQLADEFTWPFGSKEIIIQEKHLGLKQHILACGDLTEKYEDVIILEDDLFVSAYFFQYAKIAIDQYKAETKVAAISLYNYQVTENTQQSFDPVDDSSDVYFMQFASSWGQVFSKDKWKKFRQWLLENETHFEQAKLPDHIKKWGLNSWKKHFIHYLIDQDLFFVFPRLSLTTNFEEPGTHSNSSNKFQTILQYNQINYQFQSFEDSKSIYDAWFELDARALNKLTDKFKAYDYEVDLHGAKRNPSHPYLLTTQRSTQPIFSYSDKMFPLLQNVLSENQGNNIVFSESKDVDWLEPMIETKNPFFVVLPIIVLDPNEFIHTIHSIRNAGYSLVEIIISTHNNQAFHIRELVDAHFGDFPFPISIHTSESNEIGKLLKAGFDTIHGGLVTWVQQGSMFHSKYFSELNRIYNLYQNFNCIYPVSSSNKLEYYRINREMVSFIFYPTSNAPTLELMCFRAHCWSQISQAVSTISTIDFFYSWLWALNSQFDIHPSILHIENPLKPEPIIPPLSKKELQALQNRTKLEQGITTRPRNKMLYKILRFLSDHNLPLLKNIYYLYYDLPLVIRKDESTGGYYLFKK